MLNDDLQRNTRIALFLLPIVALWAIFELFTLLPIYTSLPLALALFWVSQLVRILHLDLGNALPE